MNATTMIEVPCFALGVWLVWKLGRYAVGRLFDLGKLAIEKWSAGDDARTKAFAQGLSDIVTELKDHGERLGRIEQRLDVRDVVEDALDDVKTGAHTAIPSPIADSLSAPIPITSKTPPAGVAIVRAAKGGA